MFVFALIFVAVFQLVSSTTFNAKDNGVQLRGSLPDPWTHSIDPARVGHVRWEDHPDKKVQDFFEGRRLFVNILNQTHHQHAQHHQKAWEVLAEVDGLKNEDVLVFVTSTTAVAEVYLWERSVGRL
jgi:hypothetical protein